MFPTNGKLSLACLAMVSVFSLIGLSLRQGETAAHDYPLIPPLRGVFVPKVGDVFDDKFSIHSLGVSRDRKWIAIGLAPPAMRVVLVNAETSKVVRELGYSHLPVDKLVFSPDGKLLYGSGNGPLSVWDVATGQIVKVMEGFWALSSDGKHLATVESFVDVDPGIEYPPRKALPPTFTLQVFETATWKRVSRLHEENATMRALCFSPDGKTLALSVFPYDIRLWDWQAGKDRLRIAATKGKKGDGFVPYLEFSPDGSLLASMTDWLVDYYYDTPRKIDLWNASTGKLVRSLELTRYRPQYLTFTPKGDQIAMRSEPLKFRLIDVAAGKTTKEFKSRVETWDGLAPALYREGLAPEQSHKAAPVFRQLWIITGGADIETRKLPQES